MYLAFDPGQTTGWCRFADNGDSVDYGQVYLDELPGLIDLMVIWAKDDPLKVIIYEDYRLFGHKAKAQIGSKMPASVAIGSILTLAHRTGAPTVNQEARIKTIAQKWTQLKPPSNHAQSHWVDAYNHGAYYLINEGIKKTALELEAQNGNPL